MLALLLAVAIPAAPATPPPIIVTTKTSALCNAVRTIVAPVIAGLVTQDQMIDSGRDLVRDMAEMHVMGGDEWVELDNMRLLNVVDFVAQNNIKVHRLLERMQNVALKDPVEATELSSLRTRLLNIADEQAESLNLLSGTAGTEALSEIQGFANPMAAMIQPDTLRTSNTQTANAPEDEQSPAPPDTSNALGAKQSVTGIEESPIVSLVRPIVERCR